MYQREWRNRPISEPRTYTTRIYPAFATTSPPLDGHDEGSSEGCSSFVSRSNYYRQRLRIPVHLSESSRFSRNKPPRFSWLMMRLGRSSTRSSASILTRWPGRPVVRNEPTRIARGNNTHCGTQQLPLAGSTSRPMTTTVDRCQDSGPTASSGRARTRGGIGCAERIDQCREHLKRLKQDLKCTGAQGRARGRAC